MEIFVKAVAIVLIAVVLVLTLGRNGQDIGILLIIAVCCIIGVTAIKVFVPLVDFLYDLQSLTCANHTIIKILFKLIGISFISEIAAVVCADAGYSSLGKCVQLLASATILYLSIPVLQKFTELIQEIMGGI